LGEITTDQIAWAVLPIETAAKCQLARQAFFRLLRIRDSLPRDTTRCPATAASRDCTGFAGRNALRLPAAPLRGTNYSTCLCHSLS